MICVRFVYIPFSLFVCTIFCTRTQNVFCVLCTFRFHPFVRRFLTYKFFICVRGLCTFRFHPLLQIANLYRFVATFVAGFWNSIRSHTTANFPVTHVREWRTKVASTCAFPFCALLITTQLEKVTI